MFDISERYSVSVAWLYLQPRVGSNLAFSFSTNACFGPPQGKAGQIDFDNESGIRWNVTRALSPSSWVSITGTHFTGDVALSLIASNVDASYQQNNAIAGKVVDFEERFDQVVPMLDIETSIGYDITRHVTLSAGYQFSFWFNMVTQPEFITALQHGNSNGDPSDTMSFDGVFARVQIHR